MRVAIVGAGMAGLSAATALVRDGATVALFDKAHGAGGRMATRRLDTVGGEATFDHGAQYFTVRDAAFAEQVARWQDAGVVARWSAAGNDAWVGTPAMNAPLRALAGALDVTWHARIEAITRDGERWVVTAHNATTVVCDALVVAIPAEQAATLVVEAAPAMAARAAQTASAPCWTVMAAFADRVACDDIVRDAGAIGWAARNLAKPGRGGPESWVVQASPAWSRDHLEDNPDLVVTALLAAFAGVVGQPLPLALATTAHRWRYARSGVAGTPCLWDAGERLGVCGDWLIGPRVEAAWQSGAALASAMRA